jgi:yecA family protein
MLVYLSIFLESTMSEMLPPYEAVAHALRHTNALTSPSESHGLLTGILCGSSLVTMDAEGWARHAAGAATQSKEGLSEQEITTLKSLFSITQRKLHEGAFDFQLLLPEDEVTLVMRARELGNWCRGFLSGFSMHTITVTSEEDYEEIQEILQQVADISEIEYDQLSIGEEDENAFTEVTEYLRLAILNLHMMLIGNQPSEDNPGASSSQSIH